MDYKQKWERLKEWLEQAVEEGKNCGYNERHRSAEGGMYYSYYRTLEKMIIMEGVQNESN